MLCARYGNQVDNTEVYYQKRGMNGDLSTGGIVYSLKKYTMLCAIVLLSVIFSAGEAFAAMSPKEFRELCTSGTPQQVIEAIQNGADVNAIDKNGSTPLMYAAEHNSNPEVISTLIKLGADPKIKDKFDKMALDYAKINKNLKNTDVLQKLEDVSF